MSHPRILIACVGNIFLGDDGFGTAVARGFSGRSLPPGVILRDFGIRGLDLTYALLEPYELVVLVDACPRGGTPGTVYLIEPDLSDVKVSGTLPSPIDAHSMNPMNVLRTAKEMGGVQGRILIVGCEPANLESIEEEMNGLSEPVQSAIGEAIEMIEAVVAKALNTKPAELTMQFH